MLRVNNLMGFGIKPVEASGAAILETDLQMHLDIGNIACVSSTSTQEVLDLTTNSYDWYLGKTVSASTDDPTINGTPGNLSSSEYLSTDGGDMLRTQAAYSGSIMRTIGRSGQEFSMEFWLYLTEATPRQFLFANLITSGSAKGMRFQVEGDKLEFEAYPLGTAYTSTTTLTSLEDEWIQVGVAGDCNGSGITFYLNGATDGTASPNNTGWTSGDSSQQGDIMSWNGNTESLQAGSRIAIVRFYDADIGSAGFNQNWEAQRARFGL